MNNSLVKNTRDTSLYDIAYTAHTSPASPWLRSIEFSITTGTYRKGEGVLQTLQKFNDATGKYIQFPSEYYHLPALQDSRGEYLFLYELVEFLEEIIDFDSITEEYPGLSLAQIDGAISFLRKVAQWNSSGQDIDDLEDSFVAQDQELIDELRSSIANEGVARVLDYSK